MAGEAVDGEEAGSTISMVVRRDIMAQLEIMARTSTETKETMAAVRTMEEEIRRPQPIQERFRALLENLVHHAQYRQIGVDLQPAPNQDEREERLIAV